MAKPEWGIKRICPACGLKYYDFNKSSITCPSCNMEFDPDVYLKSRKGKNFSPKVAIENNDIDENNTISDDVHYIEETEINEDEETGVEIIEDEKD